MVVLSAALEHTSGGPMLRVQTQRGWAVLPLEEEATVLLEAGALIMRDRLANRAQRMGALLEDQVRDESVRLLRNLR